MANWIKTKDRLPLGIGKAVEWRNPDGGNIPLGKKTTLEIIIKAGANVGWFEWLDESEETPTILPLDVQEQAKEYADRFYPIKDYDAYESDYDYRTQCAKNRQIQEHFLAGAAGREGWTNVKPVFKEEACFATATRMKDHWEYEIWQMIMVEGVNDKEEPAMYLALCNGEGEEWGDYDDLSTDLYFVIPNPPNKQ